MQLIAEVALRVCYLKVLHKWLRPVKSIKHSIIRKVKTELMSNIPKKKWYWPELKTFYQLPATYGFPGRKEWPETKTLDNSEFIQIYIRMSLDRAVTVGSQARDCGHYHRCKMSKRSKVQVYKTQWKSFNNRLHSL